MALLPEFTSEGLLPPGDYELTIKELKESMLVRGPRGRRGSRRWNGPWRLQLMENLEILVRQLHMVGITEIFADGSFAEDKEHPGDIDGYFECDESRYLSGRLERELNAIDPHKIWSWASHRRKPFRSYPKPQLPMWHQYRVELFPHYGQPSGITDNYGNPMPFPSAFRRSRRDGMPRGIIKIGVDYDSQ